MSLLAYRLGVLQPTYSGAKSCFDSSRHNFLNRVSAVSSRAQGVPHKSSLAVEARLFSLPQLSLWGASGQVEPCLLWQRWPLGERPAFAPVRLMLHPSVLPRISDTCGNYRKTLRGGKYGKRQRRDLLVERLIDWGVDTVFGTARRWD